MEAILVLQSKESHLLAGNSFRGLLTALWELLNSFKEIKPENRTGTIEQLAQNVEAVGKQVQLMLNP